MQQFRTKVMGIALAVAVQALCTWAPLCPGQAEARPQTESDTPGASIAEIAVKVVPASEREVWMNALLGQVELDRVGRGVVEGCPQWGVAYPDGSDHVWTYLNHPEGGSTWLFGLYMKTAQAEAFVETLDGLLEPLGTTRVPPRLDVAFDMQGQHILENDTMALLHDDVRAELDVELDFDANPWADTEADTEADTAGEAFGDAAASPGPRAYVRLTMVDGESGRTPVVVHMDPRTARTWHGALHAALNGERAEPDAWFNLRADAIELDEAGRGLVTECYDWRVTSSPKTDIVWSYLNHEAVEKSWLLGVYMKEARAAALLDELNDALSLAGATEVSADREGGPRIDVHVDTTGFQVKRGWMTRKHDDMHVRVDNVDGAALVRLTITDAAEEREPVVVLMDPGRATAWRTGLEKALARTSGR